MYKIKIKITKKKKIPVLTPFRQIWVPEIQLQKKGEKTPTEAVN